jgi:hypothetical protein
MAAATSQQSIAERWKEAIPSLTFPFNFGGKGPKSVNWTWKDVREAYLRDGVNTNLHRCTGHMTATSLQSDIIRDEIKRSLRHPRSTASHTSSMGQVQLIPAPPATARGATASEFGSSGIPSLPSTARKPRPPAIQQVQEHGRVAYLESRRRARFESDELVPGFTPFSKDYGFAARNHIPVPTTPEHHRRVTGLRDAYRPNGVFPRLV